MTTPQLRTECSWCGAVIHDGVLPISHGICPPCEARFEADYLAMVADAEHAA